MQLFVFSQVRSAIVFVFIALAIESNILRNQIDTTLPTNPKTKDPRFSGGLHVSSESVEATEYCCGKYRCRLDESFSFYKRGNAIRKIHHRYNPTVNIYDSARQIKLFDKAFVTSREGQGSDAPDPIFVVGLPRAGSTLLEQILASHSAVDGTGELPDIIGIARRLGAKTRQNPASNYPEILSQLTADQIRELGEGYIQATRIQRGDAPS